MVQIECFAPMKAFLIPDPVNDVEEGKTVASGETKSIVHHSSAAS